MRKDSAEVVPSVELSRRKADEKCTVDKAAADKAKKQVCALAVEGLTSCMLSGQAQQRVRAPCS